MIDLYTAATPNGLKILIMLEETGLPYTVHAVDISAGEQFRPEFLKISPNNKIPAIIDTDGPDGRPMSLFESGAILVYLAGKTGQLLPDDVRGKYRVLEWLMFQMGSFGPLLGQAHHFRLYAPEKIPYAYDRYTNEARRLYGVLDRRLQGLAYVAETYSIADIALFPWARRHPRQGIDLADHPNVLRWFDTIDARPAVQCALKVLADGRQTLPTEQARRNLFGDVQYQKR